MYLFLQGPQRVGKSTILRNALLPRERSVAGLMVQRLLENGGMCGFRACPVSGALPQLEGEYAAALTGVFLYRGQSSLAVLERAISRAQALCSQESCKLILLDEIGGLELSSPAFMQCLDAILALGKPCLGVLKSQENLAHTAARLGLPCGILRQSQRLYQRIARGGKVLDVNKNNLGQTAQAVAGFVAAAQGG